MHWIFVYLQTLIFQHNQSRNRIKLFHSVQMYFFDKIPQIYTKIVLAISKGQKDLI